MNGGVATCHSASQVMTLQSWNVVLQSLVTASRVGSISKPGRAWYSARCCSQNLLLPAWALALVLAEPEDKCGCPAQLSQAAASLQPATCLQQYGLETLAHGTVGHPRSGGALGKYGRLSRVVLAWGYAFLCLAGFCWLHCPYSAKQRNPPRARLVERARLPQRGASL